MSKPFPFSAIVGQDEMKRALLLAAVDPSLGGVLVFGDRGTGKSTAVRGLAELLPKIEVRKGCRFNCEPDKPAACCPVCNVGKGLKLPEKTQMVTPIVDLPLGTTEDRVCGALDLEKALLSGEKAFEPGLLAKAHRGFLYIDEVNLLEDHMVDLLLDVAASGVNVVEREGLSIRHPARFVLVGSGNPEEGDLRPQLLDRFGLSVEVGSPKDIGERVEVLRRRDAFERDQDAFVEQWKKRDAGIRSRINAAKRLMPTMEMPDNLLEKISRICLHLGIDGLRGELTLMRSARASAALGGRRKITLEDIVSVASMALRHRLRRDPLEEAGSTVRIEKALGELGHG